MGSIVVRRSALTELPFVSVPSKQIPPTCALFWGLSLSVARCRCDVSSISSLKQISADRALLAPTARLRTALSRRHGYDQRISNPRVACCRGRGRGISRHVAFSCRGTVQPCNLGAVGLDNDPRTRSAPVPTSGRLES